MTTKTYPQYKFSLSLQLCFIFLAFLLLACLVIFLASVVVTIINPEKDFDSMTIAFLILIPLTLAPVWNLIPFTWNILLRISFTEDSLVFSRFFVKQRVSYARINRVRIKKNALILKADGRKYPVVMYLKNFMHFYKTLQSHVNVRDLLEYLPFPVKTTPYMPATTLLLSLSLIFALGIPVFAIILPSTGSDIARVVVSFIFGIGGIGLFILTYCLFLKHTLSVDKDKAVLSYGFFQPRIIKITPQTTINLLVDYNDDNDLSIKVMQYTLNIDMEHISYKGMKVKKKNKSYISLSHYSAGQSLLLVFESLRKYFPELEQNKNIYIINLTGVDNLKSKLMGTDDLATLHKTLKDVIQ